MNDTAPSHADNLSIAQYERLLAINRELAARLDLPGLLRSIRDAALALTDCEAASILLIDPATGELRFEQSATTLTSEQSLTLVVPKDGSIAGWIATHGQPLVIQDVTQDPRFYRQVDTQTRFLTRSILGVPLSYDNRTIGVLEVLNKRNPDDLFTSADLRTMQVLAASAAVAIVNARLFQQSDLIAEMVHDIRTPLTALSAGVQLLGMDRLPEEKRAGLLNTMQGEIRRLDDIAGRFLDLARLESGRAVFRPAWFVLAEELAACVDTLRPQADARGIAISLEVAPALDTVFADRQRISQLVINLLSNAIKYNRDNGEIAVIGELLEPAREVAPPVVRLAVRDSGPGIPPDDLPRITQRYYRAQRDEGKTGTGLGLAIVQRIADMHGGTLHIESEVGLGTTVSVLLPREAPDGRPQR